MVRECLRKTSTTLSMRALNDGDADAVRCLHIVADNGAAQALAEGAKEELLWLSEEMKKGNPKLKPEVVRALARP